MRTACYLSTLLLCTPAICADSAPEQDTYRKLCDGLREEVRLLSGIRDEATAQAAVEPLSRVIRELAALNDTADERELWRYIDNTPDIKQVLTEQIELLFVQYQRLEAAECYHCAPLQELLASALNPAA